MRVVNVSRQHSGGGAFRAAKRLVDAQRTSGLDAIHLTLDSSTEPGSAQPRFRLPSKVRSRLELHAARALTMSGDRSFNLLPTRLSRDVNRLEPDVAILHWIGLGFMSITDTQRIKAPTVIRLADMWMFSGSAHYPQVERGRASAESRTSRRARLGHRLDAEIVASKRKAFESCGVIATTTWLAAQASASQVFRDHEIKVIPNAIDTSLFAPTHQMASRSARGIRRSAAVVLYVGSTNNPVKGFDLLFDSLDGIKTSDLELHVVGSADAGLRQGRRHAVPMFFHGSAADDRTLREFYSAADVVVVPSRLEAFGQVALESLACGTPAIVTANTGLTDIVDDRQTGFHVKTDASEIAHVLDYAFTHPHELRSLGGLGRAQAVREFSIDRVGELYSEYLRSVVNDHHVM